MSERICIVGGGIAGLGAAWALSQHSDKFDFQIFERNDRLGGNAMTVDIPQDDGSMVPIDISVTAFIPSVYQNYVELLNRYGIEQIPTRFSYTVNYGGGTYAHDYPSALRDELRDEIKRFQELLRFLGRFNVLNKRPSMALSFMNPFNYITMKQILDAWGFSSAFRYKILKPMFVNFVLATNVFDMPASMFSRYLDFFDIEKATPMVTWDQGTRNIYQRMSAAFRDRIFLNRGVDRITRDREGVTVRDSNGREERFDQVILACNANQALMMLADPTAAERWVLGNVRYESELHNHAIVHTDASVLPLNGTRALEERSNFILHYGHRPDNYEITYIMHNQQPWAKKSDKPCLVTYNPIQRIDESKIVKRWWFQHCVHDVFHLTVLINAFQGLQGKRRTWYCGAHTTVNSQEHCFISGMSVARQLGADYPFVHNREAAEWFNFYGRLMHGGRFARA
ncbi:MAG TPA: FAD-dependent oxidoreductase [Polyangiaceae bacterium]|jgi:predicted NAD/FAD-binding protein|nr:FAD-dependent oxidoreductase [Polyangiaceae bacterium]